MLKLSRPTQLGAQNFSGPLTKFEILKFPKIDHNFEILLEVLKNSVAHGEHAQKV
jgi:hypothetical protein